MKTSITLMFDDHILKNMKEKFTDKSLSDFTNKLYADWLEVRRKEQLILDCKEVAKSKLYREVERSMEGSIEDWINEIGRK